MPPQFKKMAEVMFFLSVKNEAKLCTTNVVLTVKQTPFITYCLFTRAADVKLRAMTAKRKRGK